MLILTVRPLAFQGYTILHITYLKIFQKLEFFEKNRKKSRNSRFLLRTIFSMLSAKSFTSQGHLIAKKKKLRQRIYHNLCRFFFIFGKDDSFYSNLLRITWFMEKISLPANWTLTWHIVIYKFVYKLYKNLYANLYTISTPPPLAAVATDSNMTYINL